MKLAGLFVLVSIVLFAATLVLSIKAPVMHSNQKILKAAGAFNNVNDQRAIVIKLPQQDNIPEDYTIYLKVNLSKAEKEEGIESGKEKFYRRLDEYL